MPERTPILFNLQDLRDKLLAPVEVQRDADGYYSHPALPCADEDVNYARLMEAFGLELGWVSMDSQAGDLYEQMVEDSSPDCSAWTPTPPSGEGWVLISIHDTEDGPYAWYARPAVRTKPEVDGNAPGNLAHCAPDDWQVLVQQIAKALCCLPAPTATGNAHVLAYAHMAIKLAGSATPTAMFQQRVQPWLQECFGDLVAGDREERNHRFLEEALELVQALGCSQGDAHQLVDYVYGRPVGEPAQEVGGVMVTLAALCLANHLDMHLAAEAELARINAPETLQKIRAKQAAKPKYSPLPQHVSTPTIDVGHLTHQQRTDLLAAAFYIAARDNSDTAPMKTDDAERTMRLLTDLAGFDVEAAYAEANPA